MSEDKDAVNYVMPTPNDGEERQDFLRRCMEDSVMRTEYPRTDQRVAVCQAQWQI